ncbi:unnamed protein product [Allacma fusca]|uniref:Uncharacterized protein n=1 Tax=Allacma fusca TaxID=39272 RepID=A0A8J2PHG7_9HEXA|nr:unnamed protein product [Allacma fusca]
MEKGKFQIIGLQACFWVTLIPILLIVSPAHSHVVRRDAVNKLCGDDRLYFKETRKCYPANWKGPCGELMVLEPSDKDKNIGECNCEVPDRSTYCPQRPKVFWEKESRCYYIYDQV